MLANFTTIYDKIAVAPFASMEALLTDTGLYASTQRQLAEELLAHGVDPLFINEICAAISRINYGQNTVSARDWSDMKWSTSIGRFAQLRSIESCACARQVKQNSFSEELGAALAYQTTLNQGQTEEGTSFLKKKQGGLQIDEGDCCSIFSRLPSLEGPNA